MTAFSWDQRSKRYRDAENGRYVSERRVLSIRSGIIRESIKQVDTLSAQLADGTITVEQWTLGMRAAIKQAVIDQYLLGHGGRKSMTPRDWGRIGYQLRTQYGYLQQFAHDVDAGSLSAKQIAARSRLYVESTWATFEVGREAAWGVILPARPGDGSTECKSRCRCHWRYEDHPDTAEVWVYWDLDSEAEHCETCKRRSREWSPLVFPAPVPGIDMPIAA